MQESPSDFVAFDLSRLKSVEKPVGKESLEKEVKLAPKRIQSDKTQPPRDIKLLPMKFGTFVTTATRIEFFLHLDEYLIQNNIRATALTDTIGFQFLVPGERLDEEDPESPEPCLVNVEMHIVAGTTTSIVRFRCSSGNTMAFVQFFKRAYVAFLKNYEDTAF